MAKPLTRLVRKICNAMGYDLLRLQKTDIHREARSGLGRGGGFDAFEAIVPAEVEHFDVYLRSCVRVDVLGQSRARFIGADKLEVVLRCINSLIRSIAEARALGLGCTVSLTVVDDHSGPDSVAAMEALLATAPCRARLHPLRDTGVSASLRETYELAKGEAKGLIYFAADDYLHDSRAVLEMVRTYERLTAERRRDVVLFPSDYPDAYKHIYPTVVMLGSHRHWRTADATTGADVMSIDILKKHWDVFMRFARYGTDPEVTEANTISVIYRDHVPTFAPLPSLAVHFQHFETLSPYFDWEHWWAASRTDAPAGGGPAKR